jgi:hypothetical protein
LRAQVVGLDAATALGCAGAPLKLLPELLVWAEVRARLEWVYG